MGRKKLWHEDLRLQLPEGTKERIAAALEPKESTSGFIRTAIEWELEEREKSAKVKQSKANR